jgi:uncharacterized protein (DUF697 family)
MGATRTGKVIVSGLFKVFHGSGTVIGGAITATTAAAVMRVFGGA